MKLSKRGSEYFNRDAISTKHVRTKSGSEYEQTDVYNESEARSVSGESHTSDVMETRVLTERPPGGLTNQGQALDVITEALNRGNSGKRMLVKVKEEGKLFTVISKMKLKMVVRLHFYNDLLIFLQRVRRHRLCVLYKNWLT